MTAIGLRSQDTNKISSVEYRHLRGRKVNKINVTPNL